MKISVFLPGLLIGWLSLILAENSYPQADEDEWEENETEDTFIKQMNDLYAQGKQSWAAKKDSRFFGKNIEERRSYLGAQASMPHPNQLRPNRHNTSRTSKNLRRTILPDSFDVRQKWPYCSCVLNDVRNQMTCGSCWAHATANVVSSRTCIKFGVIKKISTQDQISCMPNNFHGASTGSNLCAGFDVKYAMLMYTSVGIVTGGEFTEQSVGCMPYAPNTSSASTRICSSCTNDRYWVPYSYDKSFGTDVIIMGYILNRTVFNNITPNAVNLTWSVNDNSWYPTNTTPTDVETLMKQEIYNNGPLSVTFDVYSDFFHYSTGVYVKTSSANFTGGHSVTLLGWGTDRGLPYWLCVNQWSSNWGEQGFFRILRGSNHVHIENYVFAVTPVTSNAFMAAPPIYPDSYFYPSCPTAK